MNFILSLTVDSISVNDRALEFLDPRNVGVAIRISFMGVTDLSNLAICYIIYEWIHCHRFCGRHLESPGGTGAAKNVACSNP